ncbi:hypothetical protein TMatcc_003617 [Talaromyces marneffei ATCC 18224]
MAQLLSHEDSSLTKDWQMYWIQWRMHEAHLVATNAFLLLLLRLDRTAHYQHSSEDSKRSWRVTKLLRVAALTNRASSLVAVVTGRGVSSTSGHMP